VTLPDLALGATKGAGDAGGQTSFNAPFTDEALAAPFAVTVASEAIKQPIERRYSQVVGEMLGGDGDAVARAVERVSERNFKAGRERYPANFWKQVDNELEEEAGRRVVSPALTPPFCRSGCAASRRLQLTERVEVAAGRVE
jgi:hypothetical protein